MHQNIIIVSGGRLGDAVFFQQNLTSTGNRLLIACDSGARHLEAAGLTPDVLMGDIDSLALPQLADYERRGVKIVRYPVHKDFTDTALALDYALGLQPRSIHIWGALGGRIDHALANIHLLIKGKEKGIPTRLIDDYGEMFVVPGMTEIVDAVGCLVSIMALSSVVEGITLTGFYYPLTHETLSVSESRGISNRVTASPASVRVSSGDLLVIRYWEKDVFPEVSE